MSPSSNETGVGFLSTSCWMSRGTFFAELRDKASRELRGTSRGMPRVATSCTEFSDKAGRELRGTSRGMPRMATSCAEFSDKAGRELRDWLCFR